MKLLGRADSSNVRKVLWGLEELRIAFEREDRGGPFGGTDTEEYLSLNPTGLVPTLIDGETVVWESNTILRYLGERSGPTVFSGQDAGARARISRWMDWQLSALNPPLSQLFTQLVRTPMERRDQAAVRSALDAAHAQLEILARSLRSDAFLFGHEVTAADVALGVMLHRYFSLVSEPKAGAQVTRYHEALAARPGFTKYVAIGKP
ncbi:MAG: glutathione S-transferase family protein [Methylobacterium organophilum]|jgi:glutathione S-transferase|nr:glutathione S-transferase family protein [Methylobacterium organophilum]